MAHNQLLLQTWLIQSSDSNSFKKKKKKKDRNSRTGNTDEPKRVQEK
jgi:hypothetical protein